MTAQPNGHASVGAAGGNEKVDAMLRTRTAAQLLELRGVAAREAADYLRRLYDAGGGQHWRRENQEAMDGLVAAIEKEISARIEQRGPGVLAPHADAETAPLERESLR